MRVVSLCPSNTELLWALDAMELLVGVDRASDFPESVAALPCVGPDMDVDIPTIVALKPDLVLSSLTVPGMEHNLARLDEAGVPHVVVDAQSLADVYTNLRLVGRLLGRGTKAESVITTMQTRLAELRARGETLPPPPQVFLEWWPKPVIVPGARCWTTEMIHIAGGESAFAHLDVRSVAIENERVPEAAPDVLLTCWCGVPHDRQKPEKLAEREGWAAIPGVRAGQVYAAEERFFGRPGPRLVEGVAWLQDRLFARAVSRPG